MFWPVEETETKSKKTEKKQVMPIGPRVLGVPMVFFTMSLGAAKAHEAASPRFASEGLLNSWVY